MQRRLLKTKTLRGAEQFERIKGAEIWAPDVDLRSCRQTKGEILSGLDALK